jgi:hypothetical protein
VCAAPPLTSSDCDLGVRTQEGCIWSLTLSTDRHIHSQSVGTTGAGFLRWPQRASQEKHKHSEGGVKDDVLRPGRCPLAVRMRAGKTDETTLL